MVNNGDCAVKNNAMINGRRTLAMPPPVVCAFHVYSLRIPMCNTRCVRERAKACSLKGLIEFENYRPVR